MIGAYTDVCIRAYHQLLSTSYNVGIVRGLYCMPIDKSFRCYSQNA